MEIKDKLSDLSDAQDRLQKQLSDERQFALARILGFETSLKAINGDESPGASLFMRKLEAKINEERGTIVRLDSQIADAKAQKSAFDEALKLLAKTTSSNGTIKDLRADSDLAKVRDTIRAAGKPLPLSEILQKNGWENDAGKKISLRGSLRGYAKEGRFFTKEEAADTYGLIEFRNGGGNEN